MTRKRARSPLGSSCWFRQLTRCARNEISKTASHAQYAVWCDADEYTTDYDIDERGDATPPRYNDGDDDHHHTYMGMIRGEGCAYGFILHMLCALVYYWVGTMYKMPGMMKKYYITKIRICHYYLDMPCINNNFSSSF